MSRTRVLVAVAVLGAILLGIFVGIPLYHQINADSEQAFNFLLGLVSIDSDRDYAIFDLVLGIIFALLAAFGMFKAFRTSHPIWGVILLALTAWFSYGVYTMWGQLF